MQFQHVRFALTDSVYLHMNSKHSKFPPWGEGLRHSWHTDKK
jgi:hypothetical protein